MATFPLLREDENLTPVQFTGGRTFLEFLKPEEIGVALVSDPVEFHVENNLLKDSWVEFSYKLDWLLIVGVEEGNLVFDWESGKRHFRIALCAGVDQSKLKELQVKGKSAPVSLPLKLKLFSSIPPTLPLARREFGCLTRLARICGPENVKIRIHCLNLVKEEELSWNGEDLTWEATTQISLMRDELSKFGKTGAHLTLPLMSLEMELNDLAVAQALQQFYGRSGIDWRLQQQILEGEEFADLEVVSKMEGIGKVFKCHRVQLAGVSPVFAKMLEEGNTDGGPSDAKKGKWKEAQTRTVELPESEDAIEAMLHFIYYGGCQRIFRNRVDVVLELLEAGVKYDIKLLVNVAAFVLLTDAKQGNQNWFNVNAAMELYHFASHLDDKVWSELRSRSFQVLSWFEKEALLECPEYRDLYKVAVDLGPVYETILGVKCDEYFAADDVEDGSLCGNCYHWRPDTLPKIGKNVGLKEAKALYEFLKCSQDFDNPRVLDFAVGFLVLAEFCGVAVPNFATEKDAASYFKAGENVEQYEVDYLVELAWCSEAKEGEWWAQVHKKVVRLLKNLSKQEPERVKVSKKFGEMMKNKPLWRVKKN